MCPRISDLAEMPDEKEYDPNKMGFVDTTESYDYAENFGYNQALYEISNLPVSPDKVIGMVKFKEDQLISIIKMYSPASNYQAKELANALIAAKSDVLEINQTKEN